MLVMGCFTFSKNVFTIDVNVCIGAVALLWLTAYKLWYAIGWVKLVYWLNNTFCCKFKFTLWKIGIVNICSFHLNPRRLHIDAIHFGHFQIALCIVVTSIAKNFKFISSSDLLLVSSFLKIIIYRRFWVATNTKFGLWICMSFRNIKRLLNQSLVENYEPLFLAADIFINFFTS